MKDNYKIILQECVNLINLYYNNVFGEVYTKQREKINYMYGQLQSERDREDFFTLLAESTFDDREFYMIIMTALYSATSDSMCLENMVKILDKGELDLYKSFIAAQQIYYVMFMDKSIKINYIELRKMYEGLLLRFESEIDLKADYIPLSERDKNKVILVTKQFLGELHAPSRIVREVSAELQKNFGIKVLVIIALEETNSDECKQVWLEPFIFNHYEELNGGFTFEYNGETVEGYQLTINKENENNIKSLLNIIRTVKPLFVLSIGDTIALADVMGKFTHVVTESLTSDIPISTAQTLINFNKQLNDIEVLKYIESKGQTFINNKIMFFTDGAKNSYSRRLFNIPEDAFAISIVGNRLDMEITEKFIDVLTKILYCNKRIYYVFIGRFDEFSNMITEPMLKDRCAYLGYQQDLPGIYGMMDLYLNPPRQGGGFSALIAVENGVPVVTLEDCDVAVNLGKEFTCKSMSEFSDLILKYILDVSFYNRMKEIGYKVAQNSKNLKSNIEIILKEISNE